MPENNYFSTVVKEVSVNPPEGPGLEKDHNFISSPMEIEKKKNYFSTSMVLLTLT